MLSRSTWKQKRSFLKRFSLLLIRGVLCKFYLTFIIFLILRTISWYYFWRQISKVFTKLNPVSTLDRFSYFLDHIADNRWRNQKVTSWLLNHRRIIIDKSANFYNTQLHTSHCVACNHDWLQFVYNSSKNLLPLNLKRFLALPK